MARWRSTVRPGRDMMLNDNDDTAMYVCKLGDSTLQSRKNWIAMRVINKIKSASMKGKKKRKGDEHPAPRWMKTRKC